MKKTTSAQVLEMSHVTKKWYDINYQTVAAAYFNSDNKATVRRCQSIELPLVASP
jgi:hypothetical protein